MANITVTEAKALLERNKNSSLSEVTNDLFYDWMNFINHEVYYYLYELNPEYYITEDSISVVSGTDGYALPADFDNVRPLGCGVFEDDGSGNLTDNKLRETWAGSPRTGAYITLTETVFTPEPTASSTKILRYVPFLAELDALADETIVASRYSSYLLNALNLAYEAWNKGDIAFADAAFLRSLEELKLRVAPEEITNVPVQ